MSDFQSPYSQGVLSLIPADEAGAGLEQGYALAWFSPDGFSSLSAGWGQDIGVFLFLRAKSEDITGAARTTLEKKLREFIQEPLCREVRLLWIENPAAPLFEWNTHFISVHSQGGKRLVSRRSFLNLRNYAFSIAGDVEIVLSGDTLSLLPGENATPAFMWSAGYGEHRFFDITGVNLPMRGAHAGCLQFTFSIPRISHAGTYGYPGLAQLDIGMRIFFRDPEFPTSGDAFYLASHRYPLLQESFDLAAAEPFFPAAIQWQVSLDPLYPLSRKRSYFAFIPPAAPHSATGFPSAFRTNTGYTVHLLPQTGESRLVFTPRPATLREGDLQDAPLYLTPSGKFEIKVPKYTSDPAEGVSFVPEANIICGISGLEYIKISSGIEIHFIPDKPGYAGAFLPNYALLRDFNAIQKRYQRSVWEDPDGSPPAGGIPKDLPEGTDLDWEVETSDGLDISDKARQAMLDEVLKTYFPENFLVSKNQRKAYGEIAIVEDWIQWFRDRMKDAAMTVAGAGNLLRDGATTSWAYLTGVENAIYYAQPDQAVLHMSERSSSDFLDYMEVPTMGLPATVDNPDRLHELTGSSTPAFPMLPYGNVDPAVLTDIRQLEILILNPERRQMIHRIGEAEAFSTSLGAAANGNPIGTTPQGLIAKFSSSWETITELQLAKDTKDNQVGFVDISHGSPLKSALQSNQLFLVISNPAQVKDHFSNEKLQGLPVKNVLDIMGWKFELGPESWNKKGTILVFKYTDTALVELAGQPERWFMPDTFNKDPQQTSRRLLQLLSEAIEFGNSAEPKERRKYESLAIAAAQPSWTGIIMLNVHVPLSGLPDSLKALAGGMNPDLFYSQFIGVEVTQVKTSGSGDQTSLDPQQSSLFGLIDYYNPATPAAESSGYNFHVPSLSIVFKNSHIVDFAAEVYLILEKLFDEKARLLNSPNNIISMRGVAEEHNGRVTYSFGFSGANRFLLSGKAIEEVEIVKAQFATDPLPPIASRVNPLKIVGRFTLWGGIRFAYQRDFDILSFGRTPNTLPSNAPTPAATRAQPDSLSISNLEISMSFDMNTESNVVTNRTFGFDPAKLSVDMVTSGWRKQSLYEQFPLTFRGFVNVRTPAGSGVKTGYMPVNAPLRRAELGENYYAMKFDLKMGSLGALTGNKPFVVGILVAWNPGKQGLFVGLKLPGSSSDKKEIVLQGLLKLTFGSIRFVVFDTAENASDTKERQVGYLLNLKNIQLQFFLLTFPPIGQTEMTLFGDPREGVARVDRLLGWYAAYVKK